MPPNVQERMPPALRKEQIVAVALQLATKNGFQRITSDQVADAAGVSKGLVFNYFTTMPQLRRAIMRAAIAAKPPVLSVIAEGLAVGDAHAKKAPDDIKQLAIASLSK